MKVSAELSIRVRALCTVRVNHWVVMHVTVQCDAIVKLLIPRGMVFVTTLSLMKYQRFRFSRYENLCARVELCVMRSLSSELQ